VTDVLGTVGVVIVTHNSVADVPAALAALPVSRLSGVVVVDNASTDGTAEVVEQLALPAVRVIRERNDGFAAGCNAGVRALPPVRFVLLLNPDAVLPEADLRTLVAYLEDHHSAAVVAPRLFREGQPLSSGGEVATTRSELRYALPPRLGRVFRDRRLPPDWDRSGPVGVVEGACMLVDAAALRDVGGLDEAYFLFFEEHELSRRLAALGRDVHLCCDARAEHAVGSSRGSLPGGGSDHYWRSTVRYVQRWCPPGSAGLVRAAVRATLAWSVVRGTSSWPDARRLSGALRRHGEAS